jgi:hypothetical protein
MGHDLDNPAGSPKDRAERRGSLIPATEYWKFQPIPIKGNRRFVLGGWIDDVKSASIGSSISKFVLRSQHRQGFRMTSRKTAVIVLSFTL